MPLWGFVSADVRRLLLSALLTLAGCRTDALRVGGGGGAVGFRPPVCIVRECAGSVGAGDRSASESDSGDADDCTVIVPMVATVSGDIMVDCFDPWDLRGGGGGSGPWESLRL